MDRRTMSVAAAALGLATAAGSAWAQPWLMNGSSVFYNGGNVGIGTSSPGMRLDVIGPVRVRDTGTTGDALMAISGNGLPVGLTTEALVTSPLLNLDGNFRWSNKSLASKGGAVRLDLRSDWPTIQFLTRPANSNVETVAMAIIDGGKVGVGTLAPTAPLEVDVARGGPAILGKASQLTGVPSYGVWGEANGPTDIGVFGNATSTASSGFAGLPAAVWGDSAGATGAALRGRAFGAQGYGVYAEAYGGGGIGVFGRGGDTGTSAAYGVWGETYNRQGAGVFGWARSGSYAPTVVDTPVGVMGEDTSHLNGRGVYGLGHGYGTGVSGWCTDTPDGGVGVEAFGGGVGLYAYCMTPNRAAVNADGNLWCSGTKSFRIDHPDDPENKYLVHYCAEGPEPQNVYNGVVVLDGSGSAR